MLNIFKRKRDIGLILCGGGALGAYEIGAWKAIREAGLEKRITGVSGTSIGACNTAIFLNGDLEKAEEVWINVVQKDLTYPNGKAIQETLKGKMDDMKQGAEDFKIALRNIELVDFSFENIKEDFEIFKERINEKVLALQENHKERKASTEEIRLSDHLGRVSLWFYNNLDIPAFSQEGIEKIIDDNFSLEKYIFKDKDVFSTVTVLGDRAEALYVNWKGLSPEEVKNAILTSAAIPLAFQDRMIDGKACVDGGLADNKPIKPLYDLGYRKFIVVNLDNIESPIYKREMKEVEENFSDCEFIHITPTKEFNDSAVARFIVNKEITLDRMLMGYHDAKNAIEEVLGGKDGSRF